MSIFINSVTLPQANPVTKCEKIPQRLCGPAGCGFVPGPEQCHDQVKTVVQDLPQEECDLTPQRKCKWRHCGYLVFHEYVQVLM